MRSDDERLDRSVFEIRDSFDDRDDCAYWWSRTPRERLAHVERLRRLNYGDRAGERLQRVLEIVSLEDLKTNKRAAGRHKDLDDLEHLP